MLQFEPQSHHTGRYQVRHRRVQRYSLIPGQSVDRDEEIAL
jgi:hypothetical protein